MFYLLDSHLIYLSLWSVLLNISISPIFLVLVKYLGLFFSSLLFNIPYYFFSFLFNIPHYFFSFLFNILHSSLILVLVYYIMIFLPNISYSSIIPIHYSWFFDLSHSLLASWLWHLTVSDEKTLVLELFAVRITPHYCYSLVPSHLKC